MGTVIERRMPKSSSPEPLIRALVVDDREDVAMGLALLLRQLGYTVQVAYTAREALEKGIIRCPLV